MNTWVMCVVIQMWTCSITTLSIVGSEEYKHFLLQILEHYLFLFYLINLGAVPLHFLPSVELFSVFCPLPNCLSSSSSIWRLVHVLLLPQLWLLVIMMCSAACSFWQWPLTWLWRRCWNQRTTGRRALALPPCPGHSAAYTQLQFSAL